MVVVWILLILFIALAILIPLLEKSGPKISQEDLSKMSRFIMPLMGVIMILFTIRIFIGG